MIDATGPIAAIAEVVVKTEEGMGRESIDVDVDVHASVDKGKAVTANMETLILPVLPGQEPILPMPLLPNLTLSIPSPLPPPPKNLTKSVQDLTDLSNYDSNSMDAIVCCYGYGLSSNITQALAEAHRVLVPGGILVIASWEQSALLSLGRDVLAYVRSGGSTGSDENEALFLLPTISPVGKIELSGVGELEALLLTAGFVDDPQSESEAVPVQAAVVTTRGMVYPYDLGSTSEDQFTMGTILIRDELESLGALTGGRDGGLDAGGWNNLAEEGFFMNIRKYIDMVEGTMLLKDNVFKLTVSKKSSSEIVMKSI